MTSTDNAVGFRDRAIGKRGIFCKMLDPIPLWSLFFLSWGVVILSIEGGFRLGRIAARRGKSEKEAANAGAMVQSTLGFGVAQRFTCGRPCIQ
jgi:hypothetical protein